MSEQYPGGFISKTAPTVTTSSAQGMWTLSQQAGYQSQGLWPSPQAPDAQFNYVTMLLHGDGTNGAQNNTFLDSSTNNYTITRYGNTTQGSFSPYGSNWSVQAPSTSTNYLTVGSAVALGSSDYTIEFWFAGNVFELTWGTPGGYAPIAINNSGDLYFSNSSNTGWPATVFNFIIEDGSWNHYAIVRQSGAFKVFRNGTLIGTPAGPSSNTTAGNVVIGYYDSGMGGFVSNFRAVVGTAVYTSAFTPPTAPLTAITNTALLTCQSNRFIDNSTNNYTITATGTPSVQRFNPFGASTAYSTSVIGGSVYYDGTGDSLSTPAVSANIPDNADDYTVEAWIYLTSQGSVTTIYSGSGSGYFAWRSIGRFEFVSGALELRLTYTYPGNRWCHVAVTRQSGTVRMFVDGVLTSPTVSSGTVTGNTDVLITGTTYYFGSYTDSTSGPFYGYISNFRIVKGTAVYTAAFTPPTAPLTAVTNTAILLNNTNGAIYDNAMMNNLETAGNAQISTSVVKYGTGSLAFDGTGDYLINYNGTNTSPPYQKFGRTFTIEFWIYRTSTANNQWLVCTGQGWDDTASYGFLIGYYTLYGGGSIAIAGRDLGAYWFGGSTAVTANTWNHIAVVGDGTNCVLYLNGTNIGSQSWPSGYTGFDAYGWVIGAGKQVPADSPSLFLGGYIDDLRITMGVARYTANFTPPTEAFPNIGPT